MRSVAVAEWILSLVEPADRAVSTVGDFMEEAVARGRLWFWISLARTAAALLWRSLASAPLHMTAAAAFGWFVYMILSVVLAFGGVIVATLIWGLAYFFTHHTGVEIIASLPRLRFDWPPLAPETIRWIQCLMAWIAAPFLFGRLTARSWPGREVAAWMILSMVWPWMAVIVPFVGIHATRATPFTVPLILICVLLGALVESRGLRRSAEIESD